MDTELRQLRRVRWGVRFTLTLGIAASLAANVLHAHHLLIDQIIAGWPPVAVFATIEAIARVPIRRRWLAAIRLAGLGFVAAIAFWVSYWHMASVAATHGENGSKYLLPLSVDGLVLVSSISLVELTGQISVAETAARAAPAAPPGAPAVSLAADVMPAAARSPLPPAVVARQRIPGGESAVQAAGPPVAVAIAVPGNGTATEQDSDARVVDVVAPEPGRALPDANHRVGGGDRDADPDHANPDDANPDDAPDEAEVAAGRSSTAALAASTDPTATMPETAVGADDRPPANPADAVAWWRAHHPNMPVRDICAKVGRSERTVRRILDGLPSQSVSVHGRAGDRAADVGGHRPGINGATVTTLADSVTSG